MQVISLAVVRFVFCFCFLLASVHVTAQTYAKVSNVNINPNVNGYVEYLPTGYDPNGTARYPLLIFFMGINSHGSGSDADLERLFTGTAGLPTDQFRDDTWVESYTVNGQTYKFIVIAPQFVNPYDAAATEPTPQDVNDIINYTIANYRIDTTRIYLTGNSSGGGPTILYAGADSTGSLGYGKRVAAVVPFSPAYLSNFPTQAKADVYRNNGIAVWAFHNDYDPGVPYQYTQLFVDQINTPTSSNPPAKFTLFTAGQGWGPHDSWYGPYKRLYVDPVTNLNIYEWMLQYSRSFTVLPVQFQSFNASCSNGNVNLVFKTSGEKDVHRFSIERSENGTTWKEIGSIAPAGGPSNEKTYQYSDAAQGNQFYRIVEYGMDGRKTFSSVIKSDCKGKPGISVFPNPAVDRLVINLTLLQPDRLQYIITDSKGAVVYKQETMLQAGVNQVPVSLNGLPKGVYTLQAVWGSTTEAFRFIKN